MTLTRIVSGPDSGVRFSPCLGMNVQVPHSGHSTIFQSRFDNESPMFCTVNVPF